ncbi:MAG: D-aminoacylase [Chloroflexi bacterium]|nr:D-aminoacylase [Chloroflexota bacterium]
MFDLLIRGGHVLDGSGSPAFRADVGIVGARIDALGDLTVAGAGETLDATGLCVAPGLIDMHSHSDFTLPVNPRAESKIRQGITTEVIGNCGFSPAPLAPATKHQLREYTAFLDLGLAWDWTSFGAYLDRLDHRIAVNVIPLVGHGTVRIATMGFSNAAPSADELELMNRLIAQAMDEGAWGLSTGLIYPPGVFAQTDEIVALSREVAAHDGLYFSHIRGESHTLLVAIGEAVTIARDADISVEVSHFKAAGQANWDKAPRAIDMIADARAAGLRVAADMYPYAAGSTTLTALLPDWALAGGVPSLIARLRDAKIRNRIADDMRAGAGVATNYDDVFLALFPPQVEYEGQTIVQVAEARGQHPVNAILELVIESNAAAEMISFMMSEENVRLGLQQPWMTVGSDGLALAPRGILGQGKRHPRSYGTFPRVLGEYVRENKVITLPEAIRRMTSQSADMLGLRDRGRVQTGLAADIFVFNADTIADRATYGEPYQFPSGIEYVIVNGQVTVARDKQRDVMAGKVMRK